MAFSVGALLSRLDVDGDCCQRSFTFAVDDLVLESELLPQQHVQKEFFVVLLLFLFDDVVDI